MAPCTREVGSSPRYAHARSAAGVGPTRARSHGAVWVVAGALTIALAGACGTDRFPRSDDLPTVPGSTPFEKLDREPARSNAFGVQCVVFSHPAGDAIDEPALLERDGMLELYYANVTRGRIERVRARVGTIEAGGAFDLDPEPDVVLEPEEPWEAGGVTAPTALADEGGAGVSLWYGAASGAGIGHAYAPDGTRFARDPREPVLVAAHPWERGIVHSPSVARGDRLWLAYAAGDGAGIGLASGTRGGGFVRVAPEPVLVPSAAADAWDALGVAAPHLWLERSALGRVVLRLVYEGRSRGPFLGVDASLGEAGSYDGVSWSAWQGNPTLAEVPALALTAPVLEAAPGGVGAPGQRVVVFRTELLDGSAAGIGWAAEAPR